MNASYSVVFVYVFTVFLVMVVGVLWPQKGSPMLIVIAPSEREEASDDVFYSIIDGTEARLVDKLSSHQYIVIGNDAALVSQLYENGAFLVLKADPNLGCAAAPQTLDAVPFRRI